MTDGVVDHVSLRCSISAWFLRSDVFLKANGITNSIFWSLALQNRSVVSHHLMLFVCVEGWAWLLLAVGNLLSNDSLVIDEAWFIRGASGNRKSSSTSRCRHGYVDYTMTRMHVCGYVFTCNFIYLHMRRNAFFIGTHIRSCVSIRFYTHTHLYFYIRNTIASDVFVRSDKEGHSASPKRVPLTNLSTVIYANTGSGDVQLG